MKKFCCIGFWPGFETEDENFFVRLLKKSGIQYTFVSSIENSDILLVGCFITPNQLVPIHKHKGKKILAITEPFSNIFTTAYPLYQQNVFDMVIGCIGHDPKKGHYKYPLYIMYSYDYLDNNKYKEVNSINEYNQNKKCCTLITRHDMFYTRGYLYSMLTQMGIKVTCPGKLYNNCSNNELESIGNIKYINQFYFNLCPENSLCEFNGYITEKLMRCCLGSAIPIYTGSFDEIDEKVFNKSRIIFYKPYDRASLEYTANFVQYLYNNKSALEAFYKQPVFMEGAWDTIKQLETTLAQAIADL